MGIFADAVADMDAEVLAHLDGVPVVYEPRRGAPVTVQGIFDAAYVRADAGGAGVSSTTPAVFCLLAALPADPEEDDPTVTVGGVAYRVREVQRDGQGGVLLMLARV